MSHLYKVWKFLNTDTNKLYSYYDKALGGDLIDISIENENKDMNYIEHICYKCQITRHLVVFLLNGLNVDPSFNGDKFYFAQGIYAFDNYDEDNDKNSHTLVYEVYQYNNKYFVDIIESDAFRRMIPTFYTQAEDKFLDYIESMIGDKKIIKIIPDIENIKYRFNNMVDTVKKFSETDEGRSDEYFAVIDNIKL